MSDGLGDDLFQNFINWLYSTEGISVPEDFHLRCGLIEGRDKLEKEAQDSPWLRSIYPATAEVRTMVLDCDVYFLALLESPGNFLIAVNVWILWEHSIDVLLLDLCTRPVNYCLGRLVMNNSKSRRNILPDCTAFAR